MAFIIENGTVVSFAEYSDVLAKDLRLFDSNEALTDEVVETALERSTERILDTLRSSSWWREYYLKRTDATITNIADIPALDPTRILARQNDFTDLCVYWALAEYILPSTANFGDEGDDDRNKMGWYANKKTELLGELISAGDWYDFDGDSTVESPEKQPGYFNLRRFR